jgi:hypothetical protein
MKLFLAVLLFSPALHPQGSPPETAGDEEAKVLQYSVNWPSGLSLGEARLSSRRAKGDRWEFTFSLDAAVPGFQVLDKFRATAATSELCSVEFERDLVHGSRKTREKITFDQQRNIATRQTIDGGKSELSLPPCGRDALTFVHFVRRELAQGRLPSTQQVFYGAAYRVRLEYTGTQRVRLQDSQEDADRLTVSIKGPASEVAVEMFFARDPARTPLLIKAPLALGTFSMELVR